MADSILVVSSALRAAMVPPAPAPPAPAETLELSVKIPGTQRLAIQLSVRVGDKHSAKHHRPDRCAVQTPPMRV